MNLHRIHSITVEIFDGKFASLAEARRADADAVNVITFYGEGSRPLDSLSGTVALLTRHDLADLRAFTVISLIDGSCRYLPATSLGLVPASVRLAL